MGYPETINILYLPFSQRPCPEQFFGQVVSAIIVNILTLAPLPSVVLVFVKFSIFSASRKQADPKLSKLTSNQLVSPAI